MSVGQVHAVLLEARESIGYPGTETAGGFELPCRFWEPNSSSPQEQQVRRAPLLVCLPIPELCS